MTAFDVDAGGGVPQFQSEMSIAIHPDDPLRVAVVSMSGGGGGALLAASSSDGGRTWSQNHIPSAVSGGWVDADPMLAFDAEGVLHLIHIPTGPSGPGPLGIDMIRSADGGLTWDSNRRISANLGADDKVAIAVDTRHGSPHLGNIYVAWKWPAQDIFFTRSTDGGASYEPVQRIPHPASSAPDLEVTPDGTVHLVANVPSRRAIVHADSTDGGRSFSTLEPVARTNIGFFTRPRAACQRLSLIQPSIATDASSGPRHGTLYVVWNDHQEQAGCIDPCAADNPCDTDVFLSRSEDGGATWSDPVVVHPDAPQGSDQFHPWVAVDSADGTVFATFKDTRDDPQRWLAHTSLARSTDGGRTWEPSWTMSSATGVAGSSFQFGDYQGLAARAGRVYAAWADFRVDPAISELYVGVAQYPPPTTRRVVPAAVQAEGARGTTWATSLAARNSGTEVANVQLVWHPEGATPAEAVAVGVEVSAGGSRRIEDVVATVFGGAGTGWIDITAPPGVLVTTRTATVDSQGSYGQLVPELDPAAAIAPSGEARLLMLSESDDPDTGTRTNLGLVNLTDTRITASIDLLDPSGASLGVVTVELGARRMRQLNRILTRVADTDVADAVAVVTVDEGSSPPTAPSLFAYASVIDNRTGDPTLILPGEPIRSAGTFAAAANLPGAQDTVWTTEAAIHNPGDSEATVRLQLLATGATDPVPPSASLTLPAGATRRFSNVLSEVFGTVGSGAVRVLVDGGPVVATSRTFNRTARGTYGQGIPLVPDHRSLEAGRTAALLHLSRVGAPVQETRTNLGLVNLGGDPMVFVVALIAADGSELGQFTRRLEPSRHLQVNDVLGDIVGGASEDTTARVEVTAGNGRWLAYASVVDGATGDPVFVLGR